MPNHFIEAITKRRSIYQLGNKVNLSEKQIIELVKEAIKQTPSAFNSQSARAVILFPNQHHRFWQLVHDALKAVVPADKFSPTAEKIASFDRGYGTILFFNDMTVVKNLQSQFPLYSQNFPIWAEQAGGMAQFTVWTALATVEIGASLQHYSPLIDDDVRQEWNIPESWKLTAQMPFGSIEAPADPKTFVPIEQRVLVKE